MGWHHQLLLLDRLAGQAPTTRWPSTAQQSTWSCLPSLSRLLPGTRGTIILDLFQFCGLMGRSWTVWILILIHELGAV